jgi:integrase
MGSLYVKRGKLWMRFKDETGKWKGAPTPYTVDERSNAERFLKKFETNISPASVDAPSGSMTVARYIDVWTESRRGLKVTVDLDEQRLTDHCKSLHDLPLEEVRPKHVRELVLGLRKAGKLAPRTIRNVYGALHSMFHSAVCDDLIAATPCVVERGTLPKLADADPTWRATAIFTHEEVERIISDGNLLPDRLVYYALMALAGLRHAEAARLRWSDFDRRREPLACLRLPKTKSGVPREVPVHPALARILGEWHLAGWAAVYGRPPRADDLVVPTRLGTERDGSDAQHSFGEDLARLALRHRRQHDLRRTFITLAQQDGAARDVLKACTHGTSATDMMSLYSSFSWPSKCEAVAKLRVEVLPGACYHLATRKRSIQISSINMATPAGFEPASPT